MPEQAHTDDGDEQDDDSVSDRLNEVFDRVGHLDDLAYDVDSAVRSADEEGQDAYDAVEGLHETARTISHALNDEAAYAQEAQDLIDRMGEEIQAIDATLAAIEEDVAEQGGDPPLGSEATDFDLVKTAQLLLHEAAALNESEGNGVAAARFEACESVVSSMMSREFVERGAMDSDLEAARRGAERALDGTEVVTWPRTSMTVCDECGYDDVRKAGTVCPMCEDGTMTDPDDSADPDDEIYVVVDTDVPEGNDTFEAHGVWRAGVPVIIEERLDAPAAVCEDCGTTEAALYRLKNDDCGIPLCQDCLLDQRWAERIESHEGSL